MKTNQMAVQAAEYEIITLPSGLTVQVRPMPGYSSVHAVYGTDFGSIDRFFTVDGKKVVVPEGTAHFLEHKMFESDEGDAFSLYAKTGAQANAFTSFEKTCYIFTATSQIDESLDVLLGMVGKPYFTEQTIAKEQGIIGQEIKMYDDSPDWRMLTESMRCLYSAHPIRDDIAGTVESIAQITPEMLYDCCKAFYRPGSMVLSVAGNVTKEQVLAACARAGLDKPVQQAPKVERLMPADCAGVAQSSSTLYMPVAKPCFALAYKEKPVEFGDTRRAILYDMISELICGGMTPLYRRLYDSGLVNPEFDGDFMSVRGAGCFMFSGESSEPEKVEQMIWDEIERLRREGVDEETFTLCKNQSYGSLITDLGNVEDTASAMNAAFMKGRTLSDEITALASLTKQDADEALQTMLLRENCAVVHIYPAEA